MAATIKNALARGSALILCSCTALASGAQAYTLWSSSGVPGGAGELLWPGTGERAALPDLTFHNLAFVANEAFRVPYQNNGGTKPNICGDDGHKPSGQLSNGAPLNENVDACALQFGARKVLMTVARSKERSGEPLAFFDDNGQLVVAAEFSLDFGDGKVIDLPLLSTTGTVRVPFPAARGGDAKGQPAYGTTVSGKLGDADGDGWIDGTLVAVGVVPKEAPVSSGETFVLYRNFQMDVPVKGVRSGNVKSMQKR
jgi:hypothetical protein